MPVFPASKANVCTTVFIIVGAGFLEIAKIALYRSPEY